MSHFDLWILKFPNLYLPDFSNFYGILMMEHQTSFPPHYFAAADDEKLRQIFFSRSFVAEEIFAVPLVAENF